MWNNKNNAALDVFLERIRTDIVTLSDERTSMSETAFAKLNGISVNAVRKHMGQCPDKDIQRSDSRLVILDKVEVHEYRTQWWSDMKIAKHLKTSTAQVWIQCWSREENWFPRREVKKYKQSVDDRWLNTAPWEKLPKLNEYWRGEWEVVQVGERPIDTLHQLTKWW